MTLPVLAVVYAVVGGLCWFYCWRHRCGARVAPADLVLFLMLWPFYAPVAMQDYATESANDAEVYRELFSAVDMDPPRAVGDWLSPDIARRCATRIHVVSTKIREIDSSLQRPEFNEPAVRSHQQLLIEASASAAMVSAVAARLHSIATLRTLRQRYAEQLSQIRELLAQLIVKAELVRVVSDDAAMMADLTDELSFLIDAFDSLGFDGKRDTVVGLCANHEVSGGE